MYVLKCIFGMKLKVVQTIMWNARYLGPGSKPLEKVMLFKLIIKLLTPPPFYPAHFFILLFFKPICMFSLLNHAPPPLPEHPCLKK